MKKHKIISIIVTTSIFMAFAMGSETTTSADYSSLQETEVVSETQDIITNEEQSTIYSVQVLLSSVKHTAKDGRVVALIEYEYDEKGNLIKEFNHTGDKSAGGTVYEYDSTGKTISFKHLSAEDNNGNRYLVEEGAFDSDGNMKKLIHYTDYGEKLDYYSVYSYDHRNQLMDECMYDSFDQIITIVQYTYDNQGNLIDESHFDENGRLLYSYIYEWDEFGNEIKEETDISIFEYEYDSNGNITDWKKYDKGTGSLLWHKTYEYEYCYSSVTDEYYITKCTEYIDGVMSYSEEFQVDLHGNRESYKYINEKGKIEKWIEYTNEYYDMTRLLSNIGYSKDGTFYESTVYEYITIETPQN